MKTYKFITLALLAFFIFGCGSGASTPSGTPGVVSPTDTLKAFIDASNKKDANAIKQTLSRSSLALVETVATAQKTTVDDLLNRGNTDMVGEMPDIRNEKIENEMATVEVKIKTTGYDTIPFVKEDGVWKIAFDKYQQAMMEKARQDMKAPAGNLAVPTANQTAPAANQKPAAPANKPAANK